MDESTPPFLFLESDFLCVKTILAVGFVDHADLKLRNLTALPPK